MRDTRQAHNLPLQPPTVQTLNTQQVCRALDMGTEWVRREARAGRLKSFYLGNQMRFRLSDICDYQDERMKERPAKRKARAHLFKPKHTFLKHD